MKSTDKFMRNIKHALENKIPATVTVNGITCEFHVLELDDVSALGERGGVVSFFIRELDEDGRVKNVSMD